MFEGIFEALKINFPLNFTLNKLKVFQIMRAGTKKCQNLYFGGARRLFEKQNTDKIFQNLSLKKSLINIKSNLFLAYFVKITIYFLEFMHNFHIFIDFSLLNDEF